MLFGADILVVPRDAAGSGCRVPLEGALVRVVCAFRSQPWAPGT